MSPMTREAIDRQARDTSDPGLAAVVTTVTGAEFVAALLDGLDPRDREHVSDLIAHPPVSEGGRRPRL